MNWRLGAALVAAVVIGVVVFAITRSGGASRAASPVRVSGAAVVARRDLVQTDNESGKLGYTDPRAVYNRLAGTITWLPSVGQEIKPGQRLFAVDGEPVILMGGTTPAYRDLSAADVSGPDVLQQNRDLVRLHLDPYPIVLDDQWQPATTDGVEALQKSLNETQTGVLMLGQVVFLPGDRLISGVEATLGSPAGPGEVLQSSSTKLVATVDLAASKQSEARRGERVSVELPSDRTVPGVIATLGAIAQSTTKPGNGSGAVAVTIGLRRRLHGRGLDDAPVSVGFTQAVARHVLSVPVTALVATSGGGYAVQEAAPPHRLIRARTGLFAAGYVQVSGPGIVPGLKVTDSQG